MEKDKKKDRKKDKKKDKMNDTFKIRIASKDKEAFEQCAASMNLTPSSYARQKLMCNDLISTEEIPVLINTWTILDALCREIEKSNDGHLKARMKKILESGRK